jgi:hypothetical protein
MNQINQSSDKIENNQTVKRIKKIMSEIFKVTPQRVRKTNGTVLTPEMSIIVKRRKHTSDPLYNGSKKIKETDMRLYGFDYQKACYSKNNLNN